MNTSSFGRCTSRDQSVLESRRVWLTFAQPQSTCRALKNDLRHLAYASTQLPDPSRSVVRRGCCTIGQPLYRSAKTQVLPILIAVGDGDTFPLVVFAFLRFYIVHMHVYSLADQSLSSEPVYHDEPNLADG